ncbi:MAG: 4-(cytidine 5'-diphospho)-2-C-methyl-D-erythritol kinase [Pseudomonadota bacterium]
MTAAEGFAPAKVNLTLHITGQREDGYHLLDSLVVFADVGDRLTVALNEHPGLDVTGPMAAGVPTGDGNLAVRAAAKLGVTAKIHLEKNLPHAAGLGGGSSDAATTLRVLSRLTGADVPDDVTDLGADVPVCLGNSASRMQGIGEQVSSVRGLPCFYAVLVNPGIELGTPDVFKALDHRWNTPMPDEIPVGLDALHFIDWLRAMRNDLEAPATALAPRIRQVLDMLNVTSGCRLARMSGSGASCFGLYPDHETAFSAAGRLAEEHPSWWIVATQLNGQGA